LNYVYFHTISRESSRIPFLRNSHFTSIIANMSGTFDLNLLPLYRQSGQDQPELPGLYAVTPPRHPARGRDADQLILYLTLTGDLGFSPDQQTKLLERLAQAYYKSPGTVTAAMKGVADTLNAALLERNLQVSSSGHQGAGLLTQAVLRGETVYLAHSGPVHAFLMRPQEPQHWFDPQVTGRGLGLSRMAAVRFYQASLKLNDFLLLAHLPAEAWAGEGVAVTANQGLESLRRRLLSQAGQNLNAVLVQVQAGTGKLRLLRLKPAFQNMAHPTQASAGQAKPVMEKPTSERVLPAVEPPPPQNEDLTEKEVLPQPEPVADSAVVSSEAVDTGNASPSLESPIAAPSPAQPSRQDEKVPPSSLAAEGRPAASAVASGAVPPSLSKPALPAKKKPASGPSAVASMAATLRKWLGELGSILKHTFNWFFGGLVTLLKRILPDESLLNVSPTAMIFFALAIPILISVVGGVVYIRRGQQRQYEAYFQQAQEAARQAGTMTDPAELRAAWKVTLEYLDKAEFYQETPSSQEARAKAQGALDQLDAVERLDFQPALSNILDDTAQITRIVATAGDIYLLNQTQGNVYRAILTGVGYELDQTFLCGPQAAAGSIGALVDIAPLPRGHNSGASLLAIDLSGRLIYCTPGDDPQVTVLAPPPVNFGNPKALAFDSGDLYIIDPPNKAVWVYRNLETEQPPHQYLGDITSFMVDVIGMAANVDDLYLLHSNGGMTKCTYSWIEGVPTRCEDPFIYSDTRPGRAGGEVIPDALFDQIAFAPPPDPSLYMLDPQNRAIYHFSLRLNLDRQYRPLQELPEGTATAFAVSPTRLLFLAIGSQVFYAALP
jgi:hypothetical protein